MSGIRLFRRLPVRVLIIMGAFFGLVLLLSLPAASQADSVHLTSSVSSPTIPLDIPENLSLRDAFDVALGGDYVVWTELLGEFCSPPGSVRAVYLPTGTESSWTEDCAISPANIVADHTFAFYTDWGSDTVRRIPIGGGSPVTLATGNGLIYHRALALDNQYVYFADEDGVKKVPREGGTVETLAPGYDATQLALDDTAVFWTEGSPGTGAIRSVPKGGGMVDTLVSGSSLDYPWGIATDNTHVYWTELGSGQLRRIAKTGGPITDLSSYDASRQAGSLAVNNFDVYWVDTTGGPDGRLRRVPKAGGTIDNLALSLFGPTGVNLSAAYVYWSDQGGIWRLALDADAFDTDTDGDGLLDTWEEDGLDADGDGTVDVDLPAMGADPNHKDIFIEVDYMVDGSFSYRPVDAAIQEIVDAFDDAPVSNPDLSTGIHLHVDYGPTSPLTWGAASTWGSLSQSDELTYQQYVSTCDAVGNFDWSGFDTIKTANFDTDRETAFHYNVWANSLCTSKATVSGIARGIPASDFIVSLGEWSTRGGTVYQQAGTFMHELGHNLGLWHGGFNNRNYKPNYLSVMGYGFQTRGLLVDGVGGTFDYSRYELPSLVESNLDEPDGISIPGSETRTMGTRYYCVSLTNDLNALAVDWNCDGDEIDTGVNRDINGDGSINTLDGYDDWANIVFDGGVLGLGGETVILPLATPVEEFDADDEETLPGDALVTLFLPLMERLP